MQFPRVLEQVHTSAVQKNSSWYAAGPSVKRDRAFDYGSQVSMHPKLPIVS